MSADEWDQTLSDFEAALQTEGYSRYRTPSPFVNFIGGFWVRHAQGEVDIACQVLPDHLNTHGTLHGGMLLALADQVVAMTSKLLTGRTGMTMHVDADLIAAAREGDRVDGRARILRQTGSTAFVEGHLRVDGEVILRVSGLVRLLGEVRPDG